MDDNRLRLLYGKPEDIDEEYVKRHWHKHGYPDDDLPLVLSTFRKKGRRRLTKLIRDVRIDLMVESLQDTGLSFRKSCAKVAPIVSLSPSGVVSVCQKERRNRQQTV